MRCRPAGASGLGADLSVAGRASYKAVYQVTEAAAPKDTDHLVFRTKRLEIRSREAPEPRTVSYTWSQGLSTAAVSLGLLAIAFAVLAVILREEKLLAGIAATLGVAAIAVQMWWILIAVAIAIVIISSLLS
jgi:hypothetical protein